MTSPTSPQKNKIDEDVLDRFTPVWKGLGIEKKIAQKLAQFIWYEVESAKIKERKKAEIALSSREELVGEVLEYLLKLKNRVDNSIMTPEREAENRALNKVRVFLLSKK